MPPGAFVGIRATPAGGRRPVMAVAPVIPGGRPAVGVDVVEKRLVPRREFLDWRKTLFVVDMKTVVGEPNSLVVRGGLVLEQAVPRLDR